MAKARQTFTNDTAGPIYISIEVNPECYELEPGDKPTIIYDLPPDRDALVINFINEKELVIWPDDLDPEVLINGQSATGKSWKFKHA